MTDRPDALHCCVLEMRQNPEQQQSQWMPCYSDTSASTDAAQSIGREASSARSCLRWPGGSNAQSRSNAPAHCSHVLSTAAFEGFFYHLEENQSSPSKVLQSYYNYRARLLQASM